MTATRRFAEMTPEVIENVRTGERIDGWPDLSHAAGLLNRGGAGACRRRRPDPIAHLGRRGGRGRLSARGKRNTPQKRRGCARADEKRGKNAD